MKALDWAKTFGNVVTIDICPSTYLASEVLNPQSVCLQISQIAQNHFSPLHAASQHLEDLHITEQLLKCYRSITSG